MRKAGRRGVLDSMRSQGADLMAMLKHPFGIHSFVDEVDWDHQTVRAICWICEE